MANGPTRPAVRDAALMGAVSAAVALGITELASGLTSRVPSLVRAVGGVIVDAAPSAIVHLAIGMLGQKDKPALVAGIVVLTLVAGAVLGIASRRSLVPAVVGLGAFGAVGLGAAAREPDASVSLVALTLVVASAAALAVLSGLRGKAEPSAMDEGGMDRRAFLRGVTAASAGAALAAGVGFGGRWFRDRLVVSSARDAIKLPEPARSEAPGATGLEVAGLASLMTPNDSFYRIDTALTPPLVDPDDWSLSVDGLVDRPYTITFEELLAMPSVEEYVTLACVSNEVGGSLVGNALWQGVPLGRVLDHAGVQSSGTQIVGRSVDGFTVGFPTEAAFDGRSALVAFGMNGRPLPVRHGFPARLVVAGLYGYVSATKWLTEVTLTRFEDFDAYWIPRGWSKEAPIKTQSRIDVPRAGASVASGMVTIAGVAWAPTRGIDRVEVQVDDGPWMQAELGASLNGNSWRQWVLRWSATGGEHRIAVRATDGDGRTQDEQRRPPAPDGATGYHTIGVTVRDA